MAAAAAFSAATSTAKAAAASKFGRLTDKATKKPINWVDYNWPTRHCGCNLLHLPPWSELRERVPGVVVASACARFTSTTVPAPQEFSETTYLTVWTLYVTFCGVLAVTCVNLLSSIVLAGECVWPGRASPRQAITVPTPRKHSDGARCIPSSQRAVFRVEHRHRWGCQHHGVVQRSVRAPPALRNTCLPNSSCPLPCPQLSRGWQSTATKGSGSPRLPLPS